MTVECVRRFRDLETGVVREVGDVFEVTQERYEAINSAGYGQLVVPVEKQPSEAVSEPQEGTSEQQAPRRRGRKKAEEPAE